MQVSREQALAEIFEEARRNGITIHADEEAEDLLDWAAAGDGAPSASYQAATFGNDIFIRRGCADNVRILREEMIHGQQRAGIRTDPILQAEIGTRLLMISNRLRWGITNDEVKEMIKEIRSLRRNRRY